MAGVGAVALGAGVAWARGGGEQLGESPATAPVFTVKGGSKLKLPVALGNLRRARGLSPEARVALAQRSGIPKAQMGNFPPLTVSPAKPRDPGRASLILSGVFWADPDSDVALFIGDPGNLMVLRGPIVNFKPLAVGKPHLVVFSGSSYGGGSVNLGLSGWDGPPDVEYKTGPGAFNAPVLVTPTTNDPVSVHMFALGTHQIALTKVEISVVGN